jgi:hypothetical protein
LQRVVSRHCSPVEEAGDQLGLSGLTVIKLLGWVGGGREREGNACLGFMGLELLCCWVAAAPLTLDVTLYQ